MSNLVFLFESFNPNKRTTFFKHKNYTNYLAYSEFAIKNKETDHGLFGIVEKFQNIEKMKDIEPINTYISNLANRKIPIYRCIISLSEYDAMRLGYDEQEKWKSLFESKIASFATKMNIKYEDFQYVGAVHIEDGHPHLQLMIWSKQKYKMNYFVNYNRVNKMRDEFTNEVFKEDLLELYKVKDIAKKGILEKNEIIQNLKKVSSDPRFIKDILNYEKEFSNKKIMRNKLENKQIRKIVDDLIRIKKLIQNTKGSIKYQYISKYPELKKEVDNLAQKIIDMSIDCQTEVEKYIETKQKIMSFKYNDGKKLLQAQNEEKTKAEKEIIKLIGNQILNFERVLLKQKLDYMPTVYHNETEKLVWKIFNCLYFNSRQEEKYLKNTEYRYKKHLSKQAKKDKAIQKVNKSTFNWEKNI